MSDESPGSPGTDREFLVAQLARYGELLDHAFSQIDTLRGEVRTLTRQLQGSRIVLGDGKTIIFNVKE